MSKVRGKESLSLRDFFNRFDRYLDGTLTYEEVHRKQDACRVDLGMRKLGGAKRPKMRPTGTAKQPSR